MTESRVGLVKKFLESKGGPGSGRRPYGKTVHRVLEAAVKHPHGVVDVAPNAVTSNHGALPTGTRRFERRSNNLRWVAAAEQLMDAGHLEHIGNGAAKITDSGRELHHQLRKERGKS